MRDDLTKKFHFLFYDNPLNLLHKHTVTSYQVFSSKKAVGWPIDEINIFNAAHIAGLSEGEIRQLVEDLHANRKTALSRAVEANSSQSVNGGVV